jgi:RNA-directed DNA polymerase
MNIFARLLRFLFGSGKRGDDATPPKVSAERTSAGRPQRPEPKRLAGLELNDYAPLDEQQAMSAAGSLGAPWTNPWFGRRDLIPPSSDPRTLLIDRLMVAEGLTTPEELAKIHEVGRQMDQVRPALAMAAAEADSRVAASEEQRRRLKEEKKQEAQRRRQERAAAIRHRHATDILFVGRGVSRGLADRESNLARLESFGLPLLSTPAELASALGIDVPTLRWLAWHTEAAATTHYIQFSIRKKSGGLRTIATPMPKLRACQEWIDQEILRKVPLHSAAHGFVTSCSTLTNAQPHVGQHVVVNTDLADFFPTITFVRVMGLFTSLGYSPAIATLLGLLVTESPRKQVALSSERLWVAIGPRSLPQGASTSPGISNLIAWKLDHRLEGIASRLGWQYTRYADDLTFSHAEAQEGQVGYLLARVRHIVADEGFRLHPAKTRVQRRSTQQSVTGIVVNERPGVPRKTLRTLRALLHNAQRTGLAAQNRDNHPQFEAYVAGMIAYVRMVNPAQAAPLEEAWQKLQH